MTGGEVAAKTVRADPPLEIFTGKPVALAGVIRPGFLCAPRGGGRFSLSSIDN